MTITNGYCTLEQLNVELGVGAGVGSQTTKLELAINAASRQIDNHTGRRFWQDASVKTRVYFADDPFTVYTDDISTLTGLIVKVDSADAGDFPSTLTITTNFIMLPANAEDEVPARPYNQIRVVDAGVSAFTRSGSGRPGVQVIAKFGWAAVPDDVTRACLIQATQLYKASDAVFGGLQLGIDGSILRVRSSLNPIAEALLEGYCRPRVA